MGGRTSVLSPFFMASIGVASIGVASIGALSAPLAAMVMPPSAPQESQDRFRGNPLCWRGGHELFIN